jgi:hypothetical protein
MNVTKILEEVQASLEPFKKAKADAQDRQAHAETLKQQSLANLVKALAEAADFRRRLDDLKAGREFARTERARTRAEQIASGQKVEPHILNFDIDHGNRRLQENAETAAQEAVAVGVQLQAIYDKRCKELAKIESEVMEADAAISTAYIEGIATRMMGFQSLIADLHAELSKAAPDEITSRPGTIQHLPAVVKKALALVVKDPMHIPANKLPGFSGTKTLFTHKTPQVVTGFVEKDPMYVGGDHKPRNKDLIPTKIN